MHPTAPDTPTLPPRLALPSLARLRDLSLLLVDHLWFAAAVALGLGLSYWICTLLGLPSPLAPFLDNLVL